MTFLNSAFLFLLSAVSIPLIIHFLSKRRIKTIEFSSLKFLEQMQRSRMRWLKMKELLLLLLRMIVIALIVLAFARPTLRGFAGSSKAKSSVAIILDRSASMDAESKTGTLFEESKRLAAKLIDSFDAGDQISIISYPSAGKLEPIGPMPPGERLRDRLASIDISYLKGDIEEALVQARDLLNKSPDLNREIYIFTDMQSENFRDLPREILDQKQWERIHLFTISPEAIAEDNIGIGDVVLPPQLLVPGENFNLEAELTNYSRGSLENVLVGVVIDGERKAQATVALPSRQPTSVSFNSKIETPGDHAGYVEIDHDNFEPDNRRYFSIHIPDKIRLLSVSQSGDFLTPVKLALDRPEAGQITYTGIGASELLREDLGRYNVILLNDIVSLDAARESALRKFVDNGGGLFIVLGRSSDVNYWQRFLPDLSGINPGPLSGKSGEYLNWNNFDFENPIFAIYSPQAGKGDKPSIPELRVTFYHSLSGGKALASTSSGVNLLSQAVGKPIMVLASGLDLESNDLPAHSFFIPMLVRSMEYLGSQNASGGTSGILGETISWRLTGNLLENLTLVSPDNKIEDLQPNPDGALSTVNITEFGLPGIYTLNQNQIKLGIMSFNLDAVESSAEKITANDLSDRIGIPVISISPDSDLKTTVSQARFGKELWKEFLILALLLLITESILGRTTSPKVEAK
jgi:hypothetical protein